MLKLTRFSYDQLESKYNEYRGLILTEVMTVHDPQEQLTDQERQQVEQLQQDNNEYDVITVLRFTCGTSFVRGVKWD